MTPTHALLLLQVATTMADSHAVAIYLADIAAAGAFGFAWRTNARLANIETLLTQRKAGIVDKQAATEITVEENGREIARHEVRLDNHEKEIERLDRDKEPRRANPPAGYSLPSAPTRSPAP